MKASVRLILIFIVSGVVTTLLLSWIIEWYKYQNRLVPVESVQELYEDVIRITENVYPSEKRLEIVKQIRSAYKDLNTYSKRRFLPIEVFKIVQPLVSIVGDQNFRFAPPVEPVYSVLPFTVTVIDGRVIVTTSAVESIDAGDEILKINGRSVSELIELLLPFTCGENYQIREQQLVQLFQLIPEILDRKRHSVGIFYKQKEYNVTVKSSKGENEEKEVVVKTLTAMSYPRESSQYPALPTRYPFEFTREGDVGVFKFGTFSLSGTTYNSYREFLSNSFIHNRDLKYVLLDLRGVTSRDFNIFKEFFEHFVDRKTVVERYISIINTAYNVGILEKYGVDFKQTTDELLRIKFEHVFEPRDPVIKSDVWILFDRYTSNAALDFIYTFKKLYKNRTIGEPTLMTINHTTELSSQFDDKAKLSMIFPSAIISEDVASGTVLEPDYRIEISTQERIEYIKGESDYMYTKALEVVKSKKIKE
ncbi:hypothetical protein [Fervidobacterium sp.]